jgi:hypothetical protein
MNVLAESEIYAESFLIKIDLKNRSIFLFRCVSRRTVICDDYMKNHDWLCCSANPGRCAGVFAGSSIKCMKAIK